MLSLSFCDIFLIFSCDILFLMVSPCKPDKYLSTIISFSPCGTEMGKSCDKAKFALELNAHAFA